MCADAQPVYHGADMVAPFTPMRSFVALVGMAAATAQDPMHAKVAAALTAARPALLAHLDQAIDAAMPGELALLALAAVHDGVSVDDPTMKKVLDRLAKGKPQQTYDIALRLLVLEACPAVPDREKLAKLDGKTLLEHRSTEGAFQYGRRPSTWDLSNTQYGALGLRAAALLGVPIERSIWSKLAAEVGAQQDSYGGFGYGEFHGKGTNGYASMTAAGIAVLAICQQALAENGAADRELRQRIARGWHWFEVHGQSIGSPKERWSYYFHYGLERAAILCDVDKVGNSIDWYAAGATMLLDEQLPGGGWRSLQDGHPGGHLDAGRGDAVPTAFAILFLRRKFQKAPVAAITPRIVVLANLGPASKDGDIDLCAEQLGKRGKEAMADVVKGMRSEVPAQRRAAAKALVAIVGEGFGYDPAAERDSDGTREAVRRAELWFLKNR